jgi:hypothetical protein
LPVFVQIIKHRDFSYALSELYFVERRQKQLFRTSAMTSSGNDGKRPTDEDRAVQDEYLIAFGQVTLAYNLLESMIEQLLLRHSIPRALRVYFTT